MAPAKPVRVSSFGSLYHFRREQKPPAAGDATKCLSCPAEKDCAYSAKKSAFACCNFQKTLIDSDF